MPTVRRELARAWAVRFPPADSKLDWARRLEPGHVRTWILRVVAAYDGACLAALPVRAAGSGHAPDGHLLPRMAADVPAELRQALRRRLADPGTWEVVAALGAIANERVEALRSAIDALPPGERPPVEQKRLSEWACGIVVRPYRVEPALPDPAWLDAEQAAFLRDERERAARTATLPSAAEFTVRYGPVYDRMWQERGDAALAVLDPVALGLGRLRRPPMTAERNGWLVGTDQSVRVRYQYYLRSRWGTDPAVVAERAGLRLDDHIGRRLATADPDSVCVGELDRVCSPVGLRFPAHHGLCASFVEGVERADLDSAFEDRPHGPRRQRPTALRAWAAAAPAVSPGRDPALVDAVDASAVHWARHGARVEELVAGIVTTVHWPDQVRRAAARKLWSHLHSREVEWVAPLVRSEVAALVGPLFTRHLNELKRTPLPPPDEPPETEPVPVAPGNPLLQATLAMLGADPEATTALVALLSRDDRRWETMYAERAARWSQPCLPVPAFHAWALANLGVENGEE